MHSLYPEEGRPSYHQKWGNWGKNSVQTNLVKVTRISPWPPHHLLPTAQTFCLVSPLHKFTFLCLHSIKASCSGHFSESSLFCEGSTYMYELNKLCMCFSCSSVFVSSIFSPHRAIPRTAFWVSGEGFESWWLLGGHPAGPLGAVLFKGVWR